jgi:hypothetical protein
MDDWSVSATAPAAASGEASNLAQAVTLTQARFFMDDGTWPGGRRVSALRSHSTGTWYFHGPQTFTTTTSTTPGTPAYKTAVRLPINADGSSNFPAKRGVISVQFDLLAAPTTTTTTTKTYDPPVWKSLSDGSVSYAGLNLNPTLTFIGITNLSATYNFTTGDCFGGSLRWDVYDPSVPDGVIHIYYGNPNNSPDPPGQSCSGAYSGRSGVTAEGSTASNAKFAPD